MAAYPPLSDLLAGWLASGSSGTASLLAAALSVLFFKAAEGGAELAINRSVTLRRLILGRHFIEGWWVDAVVEQPGVAPASGAIFRILFDDGQYLVEGESYGVDGKHLGEFICDVCDYVATSRCLRYAYSGTNVRHAGGKLKGYGEYRFRGGDPATRITGSITDSYHADVVLQARKIIDPEELGRLSDEDAKKRLVIEHAANTASLPAAGPEG